MHRVRKLLVVIMAFQKFTMGEWGGRGREVAMWLRGS